MHTIDSFPGSSGSIVPDNHREHERRHDLLA